MLLLLINETWPLLVSVYGPLIFTNVYLWTIDSKQSMESLIVFLQQLIKNDDIFLITGRCLAALCHHAGLEYGNKMI